MSTQAVSVVLLVLGLAVGGLVGYVAGSSVGFKSINSKLTAIQGRLKTTTASSQDVDSCIEEKLGKEKAAVVKANPNLASAEDKFAVLPCYNL